MPAGKKPPTSANLKPRPLYKVFVSSTYRDNEERRKLVQEAITTAGKLWQGMELFTAATTPTVVGEKAPNAFGLYDMHGNVWEWVEDDWNQNFNEASTDGSAWVGAGPGPLTGWCAAAAGTVMRASAGWSRATTSSSLSASPESVSVSPGPLPLALEPLCPGNSGSQDALVRIAPHYLKL